MSIGTTVIELHEFKEKEKDMDKLEKSYISGQKWYLKTIFATQVSFDIRCTVKSWKVNNLNFKVRVQMYGENTNIMVIPIYRVYTTVPYDTYLDFFPAYRAALVT